jgi:uncharacterized protein YegP (UPF0339 family)
MATATKKSGPNGRVPRRAPEVRVPESIEFLVFEDNGGRYRWSIVAGDGVTLAQSAAFASYEDAERAANRVRQGADSAPLERGAASAGPVDLSARRAATSDAADAERWLDEGGSFSSEAVARWQPSR